MSRPYLSPTALEDPEAEIIRLTALLSENTQQQKAAGYTDVVLAAESGTLIRWITALMDYCQQQKEASS